MFYRLLQGIAIAAIASVSRAIIPDVFEGKTYRHVINMTTIAWSIGPIVAPYIGGYLEHYIGWQASFYVLTGYGAIFFVLPPISFAGNIKKEKYFFLSCFVFTL